MTVDFDRKPGRSGPGKGDIHAAAISGVCVEQGHEPEHSAAVQGGDNQAGLRTERASLSKPAGLVGSACGALSPKDGVEAGSTWSNLGTPVLQGREQVSAFLAVVAALTLAGVVRVLT